jgi:hypothetical protein
LVASTVGKQGPEGPQGPIGPAVDTSNFVQKSGDTMTGKLNLPASSPASAPVNIGSGTAPTAPVSGDLWIDGTTLTARVGGTTRPFAFTNGVNTFTRGQVVNVTENTIPALRITQLGTGEALRVEDETTPDATAFVISNNGRVGIGVTPDVSVCLSLDNTGVKFGDGSIQTTAATGTSTDVQTFTSSGTWTKPVGAKSVHVQLFGAGAGGGSGRRDSTAGTVRAAGAGGGGGSHISINVPASILSATENVVIGAGGPGGSAQTTDLTNGNSGIVGGDTSFGSIIAPGGSGGAGGTNVGAAGGLGAIEGSNGGQAANNGGAGTAGSPITAYSPTGYGGAGGGGGGGVAANNGQFNGAAGGRSLSLAFIGGTLGSSGGNNGGNGLSNSFATTGLFAVGSGGGGGGGGANVSGGTGGNGGFPAAGGGGGGATYLGAQSGAGGNGADGIAIITTYF